MATTDNKPSPTAAFPISAKDFNGKEARLTNQLIDYYEGRQLKHVVAMLNGKAHGGFGARKAWKERGMFPRVRNITKSIVDKSGLLFNRAPKLGVQLPNQVNAVTDPVFNAILEAADWLEFFQNVDVYTRLTKTTYVLQQKYIPNDTITINGQYKFDAKNGDALLLSLHHQGDSCVLMNPQRTKVVAFAFLTDWDNDGDEHGNANSDTGTSGEDKWSYRLITPEEIIDVLVETSDKSPSGVIDCFKETIVGRQENPDGLVPVSPFYDINKPRLGYWASTPEDLVSLQEMLNLHLTDLEYAIAWQKGKTAVTTADFKNNDDNNGSQIVPAAGPGFTPGGEVYNDIPFYQQKSITTLGGLGTIIKLGQDDAGSPGKLEFIGPDTDLKALQDVVDTLVDAVASDWDVNLKVGGGGSATSGFQLVVEEMNNLNLREKRSQSMVAGFRKFYEITKLLYPNQLAEGMLQVEFAPPNLPVNREEQERIWSDKIDNNRASNIDYYQEILGMTEEQATAKASKVIAENNAMNKAIVPPVPVAPPAPTPGQLADKTLAPVRNDQNNG